ncbi:hypothetical protein PNI0008_00978 [Streptococcus pneumoniae PNI0008]|nr:hypothetical protein PCS70012_01851 [Streptococcus pneumoniae PCS70012]ELU67862.1 hypothetical protein PCS81218_01644 [Streptococcus pneumoniae PCS81218]ELU68009.1 hypothetical protein PNI0006_00057 [Streptococcus pneumoniae PNI0006]ELU72663.1 hypothetical protein PNI0008_00978 [Streptococcus pneumoniae PNI0008]ELU77609.1 hypothetical protein PNI0010_00259 [Streptococcus pneumoniae PNI0010]ELU79275.1 hypothetical protein PNI0153_01840 [Streptococcus pneumoniae PNI0153]ELU82728.1 hypothetic
MQPDQGTWSQNRSLSTHFSLKTVKISLRGFPFATLILAP